MKCKNNEFGFVTFSIPSSFEPMAIEYLYLSSVSGGGASPASANWLIARQLATTGDRDRVKRAAKLLLAYRRAVASAQSSF